MEVCRRSSWLLLLLGVSLLATTLQGVQGEAESEGPSESECRPYIEKALKELETGETAGTTGTPESGDSKEDTPPTVEVTTDDSDHQDGEGDDDTHEEGTESIEADQNVPDEEDTQEHVSVEQPEETTDEDTTQGVAESVETTETHESVEEDKAESGETAEEKAESAETAEDKAESVETAEDKAESVETAEDKTESGETAEDKAESGETAEDKAESVETAEDTAKSGETAEDKAESGETAEDKAESAETAEEERAESVETAYESVEDAKAESVETVEEQGESVETKEAHEGDETKEATDESVEGEKASKEDQAESKEDDKNDTGEDTKSDKSGQEEEAGEQGGSAEAEAAGGRDERSAEKDDSSPDETKEESKEAEENVTGETEEEGDSAPEEELSLDIEIPSELRDRNHVEHLLKLDDESSETEEIINRVAEITLRELKKLYENAIKPLEVLYKYRDLSNRHFGDAEIFSKPLILFMGPWSGGKSSIINYLLDNEYNETSLRTGAEPSPAYFNILMYGEEPEIWDGTQLAADFTFSGLQKFGQGLEERLRGVRLPSKLLEKVNIVEIPGILEVRKQVSRVFPFNDACQWFIDRADIIFLVYDPSKLDVGPETEAILDQLKGREHQTRIILNKADQVKPEELMRVQGALIWNISPLMSSPQPPVMYTTSLWSRPYESWAPVRLLQAQERAFLRDLRSAVEKRIENKIASARRFAVRVRNHAKMVDCYLTTYYNHKSVFGNRKQVADEIIEHPQDYHIYEGLSTLTNISRYDLPDPDVYRDFFKLNPLYDFQQLSATCTYFRGCPINRLDVAIAYDLPELVGKHKRMVESALAEANQTPVPGS
ncbi:Sarcalumenin-like Protein [Tribolium castaneum]|uniref:Sarcalumenin-like Protein n=1 Tax=Tribolium castaneum TaxID=7070 RepID=D6W6A8_TRICA|nr:PREDICTED: sarcalumenin isoform X1 [Tribolium castaneum]EFA11103.1 Sarcalumenin-like Protein [Tribolium castaneum]|eukprot:XP_969014.1 PREDICTED: sarcalumenin isoform X1 [Tribolium castaneum]